MGWQVVPECQELRGWWTDNKGTHILVKNVSFDADTNEFQFEWVNLGKGLTVPVKKSWYRTFPNNLYVMHAAHVIDKRLVGAVFIHYPMGTVIGERLIPKRELKESCMKKRGYF